MPGLWLNIMLLMKFECTIWSHLYIRDDDNLHVQFSQTSINIVEQYFVSLTPGLQRYNYYDCAR